VVRQSNPQSNCSVITLAKLRETRLLSEKVLEELVRQTGLCEYLVSAAWPNLATESRLQVVLAVCDANTGSAPAWLTALGLADPAPMVRYLVARQSHFSTPEDLQRAESSEVFFGAKPTPDDVALYEKACADESVLVRVSVNKSNLFNYRALNDASQLERLLFIRGLTLPTLGPFVDWLDEAVDAAVPDEDLADCVKEFFSLPAMKREMARDKLDFQDGWDAYTAGEGISKGWSVVKKAGPLVQRRLVFVLPTSLGLHTCKVEELAAMPDIVLSSFVYRTDDSKEIAGVIKLMRDHPERFPKQALDALKASDEYGGRVSSEDLAKHRAQVAVDRSEVMLEAVLQLREQLAAMDEKVNELQQAASRKRGLFG
jgi:hypothetical protein